MWVWRILVFLLKFSIILNIVASILIDEFHFALSVSALRCGIGVGLSFVLLGFVEYLIDKEEE